LEPDSTGSLLAWLPLAGAAAGGMLIVVLAAAAEMAFASVNRGLLRQSLVDGRGRGQAAEALLAEPARLLSTLLVIKVIGSVTLILAITALNTRLGLDEWLIWWAVAAAIVMLFAQILARAWVAGRQASVALALGPIIRFLAVILTPLTAALRRVGRRAAPVGASPESIFLSEDGLRFLMNVSDEEGVIEQEEKEMIASIFAFSDKLVREVMVPRIDVSAVSAETPMLDALDVILRAGHSRIPVYQESIDNVLGILYAKDLLRYLRDRRIDVPLTRILRPAYFIPESKKVDELLTELQQRKVHMSVVVDEYGGMAGLVTIEDLLEEIVGEIQDEYDAEEATIEAVNEHEYLFDARVPIDEVNKLLGIALPSEGGDTLGGFIYSQLGKVPAVGDTVEFENARVEVLSVAGRRIKQVRAVVSTPEENGTNGRTSRGDGTGRTGRGGDGDGGTGGSGLLSFFVLH
jgi:putative hemolysin